MENVIVNGIDITDLVISFESYDEMNENMIIGSAVSRQIKLKIKNKDNQLEGMLDYPFIIGKQENLVDFKLDKETVSRLHLKIDQKEERYFIQDLNSTNGTMLCGRLLENNEEAELFTGDEISIAGYRYRFE